MKSLIIYSSDYKGNTKNVAEIFAKKIGSDLVNLKNIKDIDIENYNLIGFGSGVYKERMSKKLFNLVDKLNVKDKNVFVFSTSGIGMKFYNSKLIKLLVSKKAINKGSFACRGNFIAKEFINFKPFDFLEKFAKGHPNDKDFKSAEKFIDKVVSSL